MVNFSHKKHLILAILTGESELGPGNFILNQQVYELLKRQKDENNSDNSELNEV